MKSKLLCIVKLLEEEDVSDKILQINHTFEDTKGVLRCRQ